MAGRPQRSAKQSLFRMGRLPQGQATQGVFTPAPVGGMNTVDPAGAMKPSDCLSLQNMIPYQYGLRVRSGHRDHFVGILDLDASVTDGRAAPVKTLIPFTGSAENGTRDRLFAVTKDGIFDVTGYRPQQQLTPPLPSFGTADGWVVTSAAGLGSYTSFVNLNGEHFLAYCDGENGYLLYRESTDDWIKITEGTTAGTQIYGANPALFNSVMQWKNRLWFTVKNSTKTFYLDVRQFAGEAHPLDFSPRFKYGGNIVGLWSWTLDGGQGVDDLLVGVSRGGDVVVYEGTDPALPGAFGLRGVWWVGPVPPGKQIASDFGGDLFILAVAGCIPLSKLVAGGLIRDPNIYETAKIANLFNRLMSERGRTQGWAITQHPNDNLLVINVPGLSNGPPQQLVMSFATRGWSVLTGLPMNCMTTWHGELFFGTPDGRICVNSGYTDSGTTMELIDHGETQDWEYVYGDPVAINFGLLSAYQGSPQKKRMQMARPYFATNGTPPGYRVQARYDYDLDPVVLSTIPVTDPMPSAWDVDYWDTALWGSGAGTAGRWQGTTGLGSALAYLLLGTSITNTTFVGMDIAVDQGWML